MFTWHLQANLALSRYKKTNTYRQSKYAQSYIRIVFFLHYQLYMRNIYIEASATTEIIKERTVLWAGSGWLALLLTCAVTWEYFSKCYLGASLNYKHYDVPICHHMLLSLSCYSPRKGIHILCLASMSLIFLCLSQWNKERLACVTE